ncbi:MAG: phosphoribosylanthranilate isomerase [Desulfovibrionaceae bacterium]|nr:phosphoribosylanthranilate isomerase [Desulfovibrionaceae bacterium]
MLLKVCGITRQQDIDVLMELGIDLCGFIFHAGSPRSMLPEAAARFHTGELGRVGVFVDQDAAETLRIMREARLDFAQLHGRQSLLCAEKIGASRVIRTVWPESYDSLEAFQETLETLASTCAMFLVDAGSQGGGSGRRCSSSWLRDVRFPHPWLLAGGLDAEAGLRAIQQYQPDGLDFNSALEDRPGCKNEKKLRALKALR